MTHPLVTATQLAERLAQAERPCILDCRARLGEPGAGRALWRKARVPDSLHVDLEQDLAGPPGEGGRHPLPDPASFTRVVQRLGISPDQPVVVLDDMGGQLAAARAWWMLACWAGHPDVRVLDGGLAAWLATQGEQLERGEPAERPTPSTWVPIYDDVVRVEADEVFSGRDLKVDARNAERFRGEVEPVDAVAGHIPGAVNRPSADNLDADGRFKASEVLDAELPDAEKVIAYCGSGVTACHNILAYAVAGRSLPRLYAGSWSEWIRDPSRPVAGSQGN
jgi:thiosulfate/3-mercaptopyruvate sulfurtransferase